MHRHKYCCDNCGFTCKGSHSKCPRCGSEKFENWGNKFRFSKQKRKNPLRKERNKTMRKILNNNPRKPRMRGGYVPDGFIIDENGTRKIKWKWKPYRINYNKDPE